MASMTMEAGKYYRDSGGNKVGPVERTSNVFWAASEDGRQFGYYHNGNPFGSAPDLIAEWTDAPDLTQITTAFGLLDEPTKARLELSTRLEKFDGTGWVDMPDDYPFDAFVYREKLGPVVETVVQDMFVEQDGRMWSAQWSGATRVRVTFNRIDGVIDLASYKVMAR